MERTVTRDAKTQSSLWSPSVGEAFIRAIRAQPAACLWQRLLAHAQQHRTCQGGDGEGRAAGTVVVAGVVVGIPASGGQSGESGTAAPLRQYLCVSLGSGTRCLGATGSGDASEPMKDASSFVLRDGHAEVLARRAFCAAVLAWADEVVVAAAAATPGTDESPNPFLSLGSVSNPGNSDLSSMLCFAEGLCLTLVSTHWPCGSMSLAATGATGGHLVLRTPVATLRGWEPRRSGEMEDGGGTAGPADVMAVGSHLLAAHKSRADGDVRFTHSARVKPGKGHGNLNMSCSDKVWRWAVRGVLPKALDGVFDRNPRLSRVVVADVPQRGGGPPHETLDERRRQQISRATESLETKSRWVGLQGEANSTGLAPTVSLLTLPALAEPELPLSAEFSRDSGLSRCAWLARLRPVVRGTASRPQKRRREEEGEEEGGDGCCGRHAPPGSPFPTEAVFKQLALNMKAGLPQGMSTAALAKKMARTREEKRTMTALAHEFLLSEAWLSQETTRLRSALGRSPAPSPPPDVTMAAWVYQHQRQSGAEDEHDGAQRMLWTSKSRPRAL